MELFNNNAQTTTTGSSGTTSPASNTVETWTVTSSSSFPAVTTASGNTFHIADPALPTEIVTVTNITGTTWTVTRGAESTTPVAHATGATFKQVVTAGFLGGVAQAASTTFVNASGDTSGNTDKTNIAAAYGALTTGGLTTLGPGQFYVTAAAGAKALNPPQQPVATVNGNTNGGMPVSLRGQGPATVINVVGGCTGVYFHRTSGYGAQYGIPAQPHAGFIKDLVIDGTNATAGAIGLDIGDGWGLDCDVTVANFNQTQTFTATSASPAVFTWAKGLPNGFPVQLLSGVPTGFTARKTYYVVNTSGAGVTNGTSQLALFPGGTGVNSTSTGSGNATCTVPIRITNQVFWTEKSRFRVQSSNNQIAGILDTMVPGSDHSHEYNDIDFTIFCSSNQQGVCCAAGVNINGRIFHVQGNMANSSTTVGTVPTNNIAALTFEGTDGVGDSSRLYQTTLRVKVEANQGDGPASGVSPYGLFSDGSGYIRDTDGRIAHSLQASIWNGAEFSFDGIIVGDTNLAQLNPTAAGSPGTQTANTPVPASGTIQQNYGPTAQVFVTAGTSSCTVNSSTTNVTVPANTTQSFFIRAGGNIKLTYTNAPTWVWMSASQSQY